ncbi:GGDEF domain-containing protein [Gordonibacter massiliensis (ex Traore et al. 2017)]|uniref:GGDEF domain-containing protein n=1 Tax=Gordonibacter massiliensis (ex Traore et al. 2017) TaxID=1841863 RepID=UPI001C8CAA53|nr:diguanylate cyclase [Gordonibacter massiliensis (ex Traore et al. 2017)]
MDRTNIAGIVTEASDNIIYVCTIDTNELLYLNEAGRTVLGVSEREYLGKKCYAVLQGRDKPCPSCTNRRLLREGRCRFETYNERIGRYYTCQDKLIEVEGETLRLEVASDSTEEMEQRSNLQARLDVERTLVRCARTLSGDTEGGTGVDELLCVLGEFYDADRAYLFESTTGNNVSNTYEWCAAGVSPEIDNLQEISLDDFGSWMESFDAVGMVHIIDAERTLDHDSQEYKTLAPQGIDSLIAVPVHDAAGEMIAFLGVDNPRRNTEEFMLLRSLTYFIQNELEKRKLLDRLGELSRVDSLTGVGNRNRYLEVLDEFDERPPASFGVVFVDINDLKLANDTQGHSYGDLMIRRMSGLVCDLFPDDVYRIGGDEFVVLAANLERDEFEARTASLRERAANDDVASASIGAVWSDAGEAASILVNRADKLMYAEKRRYRESLEGRRAR